jgi:hypothetical protein
VLAGHTPPARGALTMISVSHVVLLHVSSDSLPPGGAEAGTVTMTRFSPRTAE